ncbi:beta-glucuronosyltransferase GlcAT14B-like [Sesamum indicum]|uniref:Beta-glucuronosyltransferase GlcAT14B-like n=1 Tax=Sesamum indicum TaxID=4182 RepID=A0A6I9TCR5_SESIN|nr:beta-glucuronosyltransferase GlcAT14B-like [Sesamum indicum]XP_011082683.1 beta-glucuronosyltransferase GlcAT14B-like [Sesamum indicum]XP_011082684.1 beta-glucuronosyltransferase GlcAT14B-like [Sesamum indicum]XP_020550394.1 beta-glucuronosyltransferase GlcAT14B-like [Sesamum indicum]
MGHLNAEKKWVFPLVISSLVCVFILATSFNMGLVSSVNTINSIFSLFRSRALTNQTIPNFAEAKVSQAPSPPARPPIPKFAYLISGSRGDLEKLWRTLHALYHPWNYYIVHLDLESPPEERLELASRVEKHPIFTKVGNVYMNEKANMVTYRGPTMVANTLHACAILLKKHKDWDWFINLSASDYPLVTQDDLLYTFSDLKRGLNFMEHTSDLGWKATHRAMPLIVDPGLYETTKSDIFWVAPNRNLPTAFKLFTGSAWMILSRAFVEYIIWGWDNLPRTLLMYYSNFLSSPEGYFQTVICNIPEFIPTVLNHDMHYISWDNPPQQHPHVLSLNDTEKMIASGAAFARKFRQDTPVLDKIDKSLLRRRNGSFTMGGWCAGKPRCSKVGTPTKLKPGPGAGRLRGLIDKLISSAQSGQEQCT